MKKWLTELQSVLTTFGVNIWVRSDSRVFLVYREGEQCRDVEPFATQKQAVPVFCNLMKSLLPIYQPLTHVLTSFLSLSSWLNIRHAGLFCSQTAELCILPEVGRSVRQNSSLHAVSIKMLLNLLSKEATYFARGWEPVEKSIMYQTICYMLGLVCTDPWWLTDRDHQEAYVTEPVRGLVGQLLHKEPQDGAEVTLIACHRNLHCRRCLCIAVTAARIRKGGRGWVIKRKREFQIIKHVGHVGVWEEKDLFLNRVFSRIKTGFTFF